MYIYIRNIIILHSKKSQTNVHLMNNEIIIISFIYERIGAKEITNRRKKKKHVKGIYFLNTLLTILLEIKCIV